jgi:xylose dehydrogenase (NAD/NADP)
VTAEAVFDGVDLRFAAALRLPGGLLGTFDAALDLPRADELELIGTEGTLRIPDPWLCGTGSVALTRSGATSQIAVGPGERDPYRIEIATVSAAIAGGAALEFGAVDAVAQATAYERLMRAAQ